MPCTPSFTYGCMHSFSGDGGRWWAGLLVVGRLSSPDSRTLGRDVVPELEGIQEGTGEPQAPGRAMAAPWHEGQSRSLLPSAVPMPFATHQVLTPPLPVPTVEAIGPLCPCLVPPRHLSPCLGEGGSLGWDDKEPAWCCRCPAIAQPSLVPASAILDSCCTHAAVPRTLSQRPRWAKSYCPPPPTLWWATCLLQWGWWWPEDIRDTVGNRL